MELFIRHLVHDVLSKKTIDKVLKLLRKLDWEDEAVRRSLHKVFTKPWKIKYGNMSLLAMLTYDLQRYHPEFALAVVDQVLEDVRRGLEQNVYKTNQRRVATLKFLGELYIYRMIGSGLIFDTLWSLVTFGHRESSVRSPYAWILFDITADSHPLPHEPCPVDMPDDFFRIRLVCVLLDTCGMCFDAGSHKKKLDNFITFFQVTSPSFCLSQDLMFPQYYVLCKEELPMDVDFIYHDSLEVCDHDFVIPTFNADDLMEAVRPKLTLFKVVHEAAVAVDEMFAVAFQDAGSESRVIPLWVCG
jgi:regulator of nonsense transcripts 2